MTRSRLLILFTVASVAILLILCVSAFGLINAKPDTPPTAFRPTADLKVTPIPAIVLSASANEQREPAIDGASVVWSEKINNKWQIILYDLTKRTRTQITSDSIDHVHPAISGSVIVWLEQGSNQINGVNIATGAKLLMGKGKNTAKPRVDGNTVVWLGESSKNDPLLAPIMMFDLKTQKSETIAKNQFAKSPSISGGIVVWEDWRNGNGDIYAYDISTKQEFAIVTAAEDQTMPSISAGTVVWADARNSKTSGAYDFYGYDLKARTEFVITSDRRDAVAELKVSGSRVVVSNESQLIFFDLKNKSSRTLTVDKPRNIEPAISSAAVVWTRLSTPAQVMLGQVP